MTLNEPTPQPETTVLAPAGTAPKRSARRLGRTLAIVMLLGVCGFAVWYWGIREPEPKDDLGRFQGDWKLTIGGRMEKGGNDDLPVVAVRISGDLWKNLGSGKEVRSYRIELNESANPKEIELILLDADGKPLGGYRSHGIYTIDRKTARIIVEPVNKPRPKTFDDPDAVVWELKKVKLKLGER